MKMADLDDASFKCQQCDKSYADLPKLKRHLKVHQVQSKKIPVPCKFPNCGKVFATKDTLRHHSLIHQSRPPVSCKFPNCGKVFANEKTLREHSRVHDPEMNTLVPCPICNAKYKKSTLIHHLTRQHHKPNKRKCDICNKDFYSNQTLKSHQKTHLPVTERQTFPCNSCNKIFLREFSLNNHVKEMHLFPAKQFSCTFCKKVFRHKCVMEIHLRTHTGEKPYNCTECDMTFMRKTDMKHHVIKVHSTSAKGYKCLECGKEFPIKYYLQSHLISHSKERNNKCDLCGKTYKRRTGLRYHTKTIHAEAPRPIYSCEQCSSTFLTKTALEHHNSTHSLTKFCTNCNREFSNPVNFQKHVKSGRCFKECEFKCDLCEELFCTTTERNEHLSRKHTREKPHACKLCPKSFFKKSELLRHLTKTRVHPFYNQDQSQPPGSI